MYFDQAGKGNTRRTLELAYERARALGLSEVVLASTTGDTARQAHEIFDGFKIVVVTYHCGFKKPFQSVMPDPTRSQLEAMGIAVISARALITIIV